MEFPRISIKAARVNAKLNQREAAKLLGVDTSTLQKYESGKTRIPWNVVVAMSELYGIKTDFLFLGLKTA